MNRASEWQKFYVEKDGVWRQKHKGSGIVRDTLFKVGKMVLPKVKEAATKAVKDVAEKAAKKVVERTAETVAKTAVKSGKKIRRVLDGLEAKRQPAPALTERGMKTLDAVLNPPTPKITPAAKKTLNAVINNTPPPAKKSKAAMLAQFLGSLD